MKALKLLMLFFAATCTIAGCKKGDTGPQGPKGDTGGTGATGPQGQKGDPGTANVFYSPWIVIDENKWTYDPLKDSTVSDITYYDKINKVYKNGKDTTINFHANIQTPKITQGIVDSGLVYFFYKDSTDDAQVYIYNYGWYLYPGVVTKDHFWAVHSDDAFKANSFNFYTLWSSNTGYYDPNSSTYNPYSALPHSHFPNMPLKPQTKFYIRYIVIPGGTPTGRMANGVNMKNYDEVKKYFHIQD